MPAKPIGDCMGRLLGPVATDTQGNVFVAASFATAKDAIYGATAEALAGVKATPLASPALGEGGEGGSSAFAAVAPEVGKTGWVLYRAQDFGNPNAPTKAIAYTRTGSQIAKGTEVADALKNGPMATDLYYFTDDEGDLWVAVTKKSADGGAGSTGAFLELRRRP
jgi:hypothetical protein